MTTKIKQAVVGGIIATVIFTLFTMLAPMMGIPKMSVPAMLSGILGVPIGAGWVMHFMIGIILALAYVLFFIKLLKNIGNKILRGLIFGSIAFLFAQIMIAIMGAMTGGMPPMEGNMMLMMFGSLMGHIVYGITIAFFVKVSEPERTFA